MADIIRQSSKLGLPLLLEQLGPARIANVPPLPAKIARALYSQSEDDAEGIERLMAAQAAPTVTGKAGPAGVLRGPF